MFDLNPYRYYYGSVHAITRSRMEPLAQDKRLSHAHFSVMTRMRSAYPTTGPALFLYLQGLLYPVFCVYLSIQVLGIQVTFRNGQDS